MPANPAAKESAKTGNPSLPEVLPEPSIVITPASELSNDLQPMPPPINHSEASREATAPKANASNPIASGLESSSPLPTATSEPGHSLEEIKPT